MLQYNLLALLLKENRILINVNTIKTMSILKPPEDLSPKEYSLNIICIA